MVEVAIYDVNGVPYSAVLKDGIPEVATSDNSRLSFPFQIRVIDNSGDKYWLLNGKFHRLDGPAAEYTNGDKYWYANGKLHRLDGPAVEWVNGYRAWWVNGIKCSESDYPMAVKDFLASGVEV